MYLLTKDHGINDVFCVLDDRLQPSLKRIGIPLQRIGKKSVYQGLTTPYLIHVNELEEVMREKSPALMKFISDGTMAKQGENYKYSPH
ncbi:MAG: hypothetical protein ACD_28C00130G0001 [uncultured bacterium]|nr:MAG: hypothetical protein ACD_28C00130G0001 [uncultured bacterium]